MPRLDFLTSIARELYTLHRGACSRTGYKTITPTLSFDQLPSVYKQIWIETADDFAAFVRGTVK